FSPLPSPAATARAPQAQPDAGPEGALNRLRAALAAGSLLAAGGAPASAQAGDSVPAERLAARRWFSDAKFGLFIHWGGYSQLGAAEWVMHNRKIAVADYEWLATTFNPTKFDARAWVALARQIGRASCRERVV